jgi:hypothetical protein
MRINVMFVIGGLLSLGCGGRGLVKKVDFTSPDVQRSPQGKACAKDVGLIADGENNSNQIAQIQDRGGYWYTFVDDTGSRVVPEAGKNGGTFQMTPGGANGTKYAARMTGTVGGGSPAYVGMGFNFVDPKGSYDASKYQGIRFWAKKGPGSADKVKLKVPDAATDPDGKLCKECYNDFGRDLTLKNEWTEYVVPFYLMKQDPTWGSPHPANIDSSKIYSVQFQFNQAGQPFDLWVDEVEFTGCAG